MAKKLITFLLGMLMAASMQATAFAYGFYETGGWTDTTREYTLLTYDAKLVYNKEMDDDPDYSEIYAGSDLYIPIGMYDSDARSETYATAKNIKDDAVDISYKATKGAQYIDNVSIVDGKKDKIKDLPTGSYVKVEFTDDYSSTTYTAISLKLVLSVNKVSYQESRVELDCELVNREELIDDNSVYGAKVPTRFKAVGGYNGEASFDMGNGIIYSAYVKQLTRYTINLSRDPDYDIDIMYPKAYMEFYNFLGNNDTFASTGTLKIPVDKKKFNNKEAGAPRVYAYEIQENRQLKALGSDVASYDSKNSILTIRTATLGNYVLSNEKLLQEVDEDADQTFQSGYASREELASSSTAASGTQTATQVASSSSASSQSSATVSQLEPQPTLVNNTDAAPNLINADNKSGSNPLTGGALPAGAVGMPVMMALLCAALWKTKDIK